MPQMAPMNWLMILILIGTFLLMLNSNLYFCILYTPKINTKQKKKFNLWMW